MVDIGREGIVFDYFVWLFDSIAKQLFYRYWCKPAAAHAAYYDVIDVFVFVSERNFCTLFPRGRTLLRKLRSGFQHLCIHFLIPPRDSMRETSLFVFSFNSSLVSASTLSRIRGSVLLVRR